METTRESAVLAPTDAGLPSPVFRGAHMVRALADYRELQKALDESMPDQLMTLDGKPFRKKGYWRAVAVAFNLSVEPTTDATAERSVIGALDDGSENYVYTVAYRATAPSGRSAIGDGTCAAAEKQKGRMKATEHNCRSHAHTRAFNRSVSNLVGFGEVSAEEVERDEHGSEVPVVERRADGSVLVTEVSTKTGKNKTGKPWTMYAITFDDGTSGSTFDEPLAKVAADAKATGALVVPVLEQKGQYWNLVGLAPASATEPAEPKKPRQTAARPAAPVAPAEPGDPFGTPEQAAGRPAAQDKPGNGGQEADPRPGLARRVVALRSGFKTQPSAQSWAAIVSYFSTGAYLEGNEDRHTTAALAGVMKDDGQLATLQVEHLEALAAFMKSLSSGEAKTVEHLKTVILKPRG